MDGGGESIGSIIRRLVFDHYFAIDVEYLLSNLQYYIRHLLDLRARK